MYKITHLVYYNGTVGKNDHFTGEKCKNFTYNKIALFLVFRVGAMWRGYEKGFPAGTIRWINVEI